MRVLVTGGGVMGRDTGRFASSYEWYSSQKTQRELGYVVTPLEKLIGSLL